MSILLHMVYDFRVRSAFSATAALRVIHIANMLTEQVLMQNQEPLVARLS